MEARETCSNAGMKIGDEDPGQTLNLLETAASFQW